MVATLCFFILSGVSLRAVAEPEHNARAAAVAARSETPRYRVTSVVQKKPDCHGEHCPAIVFKKLSIEGFDRFNVFLDRALLGLALIDTGQVNTFAELARQFLDTAKDRFEFILSAEVRRATPALFVIELQSYLYSGGAHGISAMQYVNWLPKQDKILTLNDMLLRGRLKVFEAALKKQYQVWLETNEYAQSDMDAYVKLWPFEFSNNAALMPSGIAITFNHYVLGPYALGMPTIVVPYSELKGIIKQSILAITQP